MPSTNGPAIERVPGSARGRSQASAWGDLVWAVATGPDKSGSVYDQTLGALALIDDCLAKSGTDKTRIVSATVYVTDIADKGEMDRAWCAWIGDDPAGWPQRACVGGQLAPGDLVEIVVTAAR